MRTSDLSQELQYYYIAEEQFEKADLTAFFYEMKDGQEVHGAVYGITEQALSKGTESLSPEQQGVLIRFINNYKKMHTCKECGGNEMTSLADYIEVADSDDGLCPICREDKRKFEAE